MKYLKDILVWINRQQIMVLLLTAFVFPLFSQSRSELVERRKRLIEEIGETETMLKATQENKAATLDRFFALQDQIKKRQQLIFTLQEELNYTTQSIERSRAALEGLQYDINRLKEEYATMLRIAYRHKTNKSSLAFLFSARDLNDAFRRWQYLRQYDNFRERQAALIVETQEMLFNKTTQLEVQREEKEGLLDSEEEQKQLLSQELNDKDKLLNNLKSDEERLVSDLDRQRQAHDKLNATIEEIIREEMERKKKAARRSDALTAANSEKATKENELAGNFIRNKGKLPWPVNDGEIIREFGTQPHPTIKTVKITNNGIDIRTDSGADVYAVFDGEVVGTQFIPGYEYMVIVQHGQYYTVYSNLAEIYVQRGDMLSAQQSLGKVGSKKPEVHFEVWKEKQRLNPVYWVNNQ